MKIAGISVCIFLVLVPGPGWAKDSLGVFNNWGAFRDPDVPRCYAIAESEEITGKASRKSYASVGFWPGRGIRAQFHVRLSRDRSTNSRVMVSIAGRRFQLTANRSDGWSQDRRMDAAIIAALRSAKSMSVESVGRDGKPIVDAYLLRGAATAIDAASLGCSRLSRSSAE
ncbi:hypothetical protein SAMN02745824_2056 [Parasphingorhabdus marina DSM 22363]|uniref:Invasion protein IalB, involved in pathogenesis n=1 Tax=Parasphingorhabdus marina DSM 22363 TaxID=1123272 RepID=A0A1N6ERZ7_9SPHN|nr:hypothetical protein SAMN02745824_2056 [Parasphingorhabdus marina DSM 22363]